MSDDDKPESEPELLPHWLDELDIEPEELFAPGGELLDKLRQLDEERWMANVVRMGQERRRREGGEEP
jgi:hypothetical protein